MTEIDWPNEIEQLIELKRQLSSRNGEKPSLPRHPASAADIAAVEAHLGFPLDPQYRAFLAHANGWDNFQLSTRLFGTEELLGARRALEIVAECADAYTEFNPGGTFPPDEPPFDEDSLIEPPLDTISPRDLLPIALSEWTGAFALIGRPDTACAGQVIDIYNTAIWRFSDFLGYFRYAMVYERWRAEEGRSEPS